MLTITVKIPIYLNSDLLAPIVLQTCFEQARRKFLQVEELVRGRKTFERERRAMQILNILN